MKNQGKTNEIKDILNKYKTIIVVAMDITYEKLKNISLTFIGKSGKPVRTKISETGLRQLVSTTTNTLTLQNVLTKTPNLVTEFNKLSLKDQLVVLGVGGPKSVEKLITKNKWNSINDIPSEMNWLK